MKKVTVLLILFYQISLYAGSDLGDLKKILKRYSSFKANYSQTIKNGRRVLAKSDGKIYVQRPSKFRWESNSNHQLLLADGKYLWVYDPELKQVTRQPLSKGLGGVPALLLSDYSGLGRYYRVKAHKVGVGTGYNLVPKTSKIPYKYIQLRFNGTKLRGMRMVDKLGQVSDMRLTNFRLNLRLKTSLFRFRVPKGTDLIT